MKLSRKVRLFAVGILLIAISNSSVAATVYVAKTGNNTHNGLSWAAPKATIQAGVDAARDGGHSLVMVSNGLWSSSASIYVTNAITVRAFSPAPADTTINGSGGNPVFRLSHPAAVVDGFLVRDIYVANAGGANGGAAYLLDGTIQNCVFTNNRAYVSGGGVYMEGGTVTNCVLSGNWCMTAGTASPLGGKLHHRQQLSFCRRWWHLGQFARRNPELYRLG